MCGHQNVAVVGGALALYIPLMGDLANRFPLRLAGFLVTAAMIAVNIWLIVSTLMEEF